MRTLFLVVLFLSAPALAQEAEPAAPTPIAAVQAEAAPWTEAAAREVLAEIRAAAAEGLTPSHYAPEALEAALASGDADAIATAAESSWLALAKDYAAGRTPQAARVGWKSPMPRSDTDWLKAKLAAGLEAGAPGAALRDLLPTHPWYGLLRRSLPTTTDPVARERLRANMDRWRWMPRHLGERHLFANVPSFEVDLWDGGKAIARHRIIVGKKNTPTPQFSAVATAIIINPDWTLPQSIIRESVGDLIRRSPATARARGYRWTTSEDGRLNVTQLPGPGNSLGTLKIEMPNDYAIFFHDTPAKQLFAQPVRAYSHGCMRTQGILGLALKLLEDVPEWDAARIDQTAATNTTVRVPLTAQVPAHIAYFTMAPDRTGALATFPDIYGRDAPVMAALAK